MKTNIKNTSRKPKKLLECHCIGKILKYPRISLKITYGRFSGALSGQPMVDPGRSDVKDSYGGGLDGR